VDKNYCTSIHTELTLFDHARPIVFLDDETPTPTKVVLHFRRKKWEMLPAGMDTCPKFQIDNIEDTRSTRGITEDLVKCKGWDTFFNSWLPRSYIQKYGNPPKSLPSHCSVTPRKMCFQIIPWQLSQFISHNRLTWVHRQIGKSDSLKSHIKHPIDRLCKERQSTLLAWQTYWSIETWLHQNLWALKTSVYYAVSSAPHN